MRVAQFTTGPGAGQSVSLRWILGSIALITVCVIAFAQPSTADCWDDAWFCDERSIGCFHPDWMARLDGSLLISEISIPGTHETMASQRGGPAYYCQSVQDLRLQLDAGIRALDIRCRHAQNRFAIHHLDAYQKAWFGEPYHTNAGDQNVMQKCVQFLYDNPSEFILMRIAETHKPGHCTRDFVETFEWYREQDSCTITAPNGDSVIHYTDFIWTTSDYLLDEYPTLDEVRGKIVILQDFPNRYEVGNAPYHVITADLDKNNYEDVITAVTDDKNICIQMNSELGFTEKKYLWVNDAPREVCAADFNNDGWPDLMVSTWTNDASDNQVVMFKNRGDGLGGFHPSSSYDVEHKPMGIAAGDLNNDNLPDVAVACAHSNEISVLYNGAGGIPGNFRRVDYVSGRNPRDVCITDLNKDGWNDIGYVKYLNNDSPDYMAILLNNHTTSGGFQNYIDIDSKAPNCASAIATGDFNQDGYPDLLATGTRDNDLKVAIYIGSNTVYDLRWYYCGKGPRDAAVGDFNEDGWPDFAVAKYNNPGHNYMAVCLNDGLGDGHFLHYEDYKTGDDPEGMWTADLDNDGDLDLITTGKSERCIEIFDGNGTGKFFSARYALPWGRASIQDKYTFVTCLEDTFDQKEKMVNEHINNARGGPRNKLYINFTSASQGCFPKDIAKGFGAHKGMNQRTYNYLKGFDTPGRCGVIMMDYPGPGLVEKIIKQNKITVYLDIKPGSCPNPLNIKIPKKCKSVLPVAILGTSNFDVGDIDPATVMMEGVPALRWNIEDVSTPVGEEAQECECNTLEPDGYADLTLKFNKCLIVETLGTVYDDDMIPLTITGEFTDGTPFEGTDCVVILGADEPVAGEGRSKKSPKVVILSNYPNPFNPATEIGFSLSAAAHVKLEIYNIMGQKVVTLVDDHLEAGEHNVQWESKDARGQQVSSGIYLYRLQAGAFVETKKMLLVK